MVSPSDNTREFPRFRTALYAPGARQAHEKGMHHMFASIGIGIDIGGYFNADADSESDTDSGPEISAISVLFSGQTGG